MNLVEIKDFSLSFNENGKSLKAVNDISLSIKKGEIVALIGESGCGKSATALSLAGLSSPSSQKSGHIYFSEKDLLSLSEKEWREIRGASISMIFQEPMTALNPLMKSGLQIEENLKLHQNLSKKERKEEVIKMLESVGLEDAERIYNSYPHQLSGGQRQRIMIALALINSPSLLIADEPTTALDVTIQAEIIELIKNMNREKGAAVLLISHNLSLVKGMSNRSYIMYSGSIVESGNTDEILSDPIHPYTRALLLSVARPSLRGKRLYSIPGSVPSLEERNNLGCPFAPRCAVSCPSCFKEKPEKRKEDGRMYLCRYSREEIARRLNYGE